MFYLIVIISLAIDLATKYMIQKNPEETIYLLWDFFYIDYVINYWVAFSFPIYWLLLKLITMILIWGILYYYFFCEEKTRQNKIGYWLLVWGALGNAYERIFLWGVTDFIGVKYFSVFNLADTFLFIWILFLIICTYAKWRTTTK